MQTYLNRTEEGKRKNKDKSVCECDISPGKTFSIQRMSPLRAAGGTATVQLTVVSYTWLGTLSFCVPDADLDDAILENCFTLILLFVSHSCWQAHDPLFFPVWFSTSQSCSLCLMLDVPPDCNVPLVPSAACSL